VTVAPGSADAAAIDAPHGQALRGERDCGGTLSSLDCSGGVDKEVSMHGIIYLIGLIVVIMAILSFLGLG